ncbi:MAG TPA: kelch repeat-containing protein [Polyangiaceae bacterium]|nr:kelch repeat-containing protein [Polyangiaceae bacterium]
MRMVSWAAGIGLLLLLAPACGDGGSEQASGAGGGSSSSGAGGQGGDGAGGGGGNGGGGASKGWQGLAPLANGPRQETAVVAFEGKILVIGGFTAGGDVVPDIEAYDPATDSWSSFAPLPKSVHHANAAVALGKIYVLGALQELSFTEIGDVYEYDPSTGAWSAKTSMPPGTERGASAVGVIGSKIYVAGGLRKGTVADFSAYDAASDTWESLPSLPEPRDHLAGGAADGVFYAIGGRNGGIGAIAETVYAFDPKTGMWATRAPMPTPRGGTAGALVKGRFIVVGGEGNAEAASGVFDDVEAYDPAADAWSALAPMLTPRHGTGAAELNGKLYVPGGATQQAFGAVDTNEVLVLE